MGLGVGALSFVWVRAADPDPDQWLPSLIVGLLPPVLVLVAAMLLLVPYFRRRPGPAGSSRPATAGPFGPYRLGAPCGGRRPCW